MLGFGRFLRTRLRSRAMLLLSFHLLVLALDVRHALAVVLHLLAFSLLLLAFHVLVHSLDFLQAFAVGLCQPRSLLLLLAR